MNLDFFFLISRHLLWLFWPFSPPRWNHIPEPTSWIIQDYRIQNPGRRTAINLQQHRWLLREKPSLSTANMSSSLCFAPLLMLLHCLTHPQKQQREGTSEEISPIKLCRIGNCSATRSLSANPADQTPAKFHYLTVTGYKCNDLSFPCTPAQLKQTGSWKQVRICPLLRNWAEHSRCGSVLRAGKILRLGRHTQGSTCWRLFAALLPKKRQDSNKLLTSNRDFKMKAKPWDLAGPGALSSERKSFKWNTGCCYTHPLVERWHSTWCVWPFTPKIAAEFTAPRVQLGILQLNQFSKNRKHLFETKLKILNWEASEKHETDVAETRSAIFA